MSYHFLKKVWRRANNTSSLLSILSKLYNFVGSNKIRVKGSNNHIKIQNTFLKKVKLFVIGNGNEIIFKRTCRLFCVEINVNGNGHKLIIDENTILKKTKIVFEDNSCQVIIGKYTTSEGVLLKVTESGSIITVGEDCMFGDYIEVCTGDSHSIIDIVSNERINDAENVTIGNHVWVGAHSIILKGASIGDGSVIGTSSVVTKSIPPNVIAAGIPAKVIKSNIRWLREKV